MITQKEIDAIISDAQKDISQDVSDKLSEVTQKIRDYTDDRISEVAESLKDKYESEIESLIAEKDEEIKDLTTELNSKEDELCGSEMENKQLIEQIETLITEHNKEHEMLRRENESLNLQLQTNSFNFIE